jgi:4-hydroxy-tetrahydrodipicolinate synthase
MANGSVKPGIYAASMSCFNQDLSLNIDSTILHAEKLVKNGCHGVAIFGSTGAGQLISKKEKEKLIERINNSQFKDNFLIGTSDNSLNETVDLMKHSIKNGINRFLIMPPAYYKYGDDQAYAFFSNIIQRIPECEIILYNFFKLSGYEFSPKVVEKLVKDFPQQIVGVKDSTYNLYEVLKIPNFLIFPGSETKLLKGLKLGCAGIISAICNVTAPLARKVYDSFHKKDKQIHNERLCAIRSVFDKNNLISALHSFMAIEDEKFKFILPPLNLLTQSQEKKMILELKALDFYPEKNIAA